MPDPDKGFPLPDVVDPPRFCIQVEIPNERNHIAAFIGNFLNLGYWFNWQRDADKTGLPVSEIWFSIIQDAINQINSQGGDCVSGCDCITFRGGLPYHFVPDGHGGGTFEPIDPRTNGTVSPPWPDPPSGQTGNCLSAANVTAVFKAMITQLVDLLDAAAAFATTVVGITDTLGLLLPPFGEVFSIAAHIATAAGDAGASLMTDTFEGTASVDVYKALTCSLACESSSDGSFNDEQISFALTDFYSKLSGLVDPTAELLWRGFVGDFFQANGRNGITNAGNRGGVTTYDCSDCGCGWCYQFDFGADDGGFTSQVIGGCNYAEYSDTGWHENPFGVSCSPPTNNGYVFIDKTFTSTPLTRIRVWILANSESQIVNMILRVSGSNVYTSSLTTFDTIGVYHVYSFEIPTISADEMLVESFAATSLDYYITKIRVNGEGTDPFGVDNCS